MKKMPIALSVLTLLAVSVTLFVPMAETANAVSCGTRSEKQSDGSYKDVPIVTSVDFGCPSDVTGGTGVTSILLWVINFLAAGVGLAVVIGIIFGGITYISSDGDASKAKQGKDIIINAIIGLFLFIFMWAAVNFMIPGGLFN